MNRPALGREEIAAAALDLLDENGPDGLSIRSVAARLGASPMALYRYFPSRDALLDAAYELVLRGLELPPTVGVDWRTWARRSWSAYRAALLAHHRAVTTLVRWQGGTRTAGLVAVTEAALGVLRRGGFSAEQATHVQRVLTTFTLGAVFVEATWRDRSAEEATVPAGHHPYFDECLPFMDDPDLDATFRLGLDALLDGFEALLIGRDAR